MRKQTDGGEVKNKILDCGFLTFFLNINLEKETLPSC